MKIMTCNILNSEIECKSSEFEWVNRGPYCLEQIASQAPDIFGLQECSDQQYADFKSTFSDYDSYGMNSGRQGEGSPSEAIFFKRESFTGLDCGGYLLDGETGCIANWVMLRDEKTSGMVQVTNTHLIWGKDDRRLGQLENIIRQTSLVGSEVPQILMGDMNSVQDGPELKLLLDSGWVDSYAAVHGPGRPIGTNNGFCSADRDDEHAKVDWILTKGPWQFDEVEVIRERKQCVPASDHYFVTASGSILIE